MPTISTIEYNERITLLLQNKAADAKEYVQYYKECETFINEEYEKLSKEIQGMSYEASRKESDTIAEKCRQWRVLAEKWQQLLQTKGIEKFDDGLDRTKAYLTFRQQELTYTLLIMDKIHYLMLTDSGFRDVCSQMLEDFQQTIIKTFLRAYEGNGIEEPLSGTHTAEEIFTKTLKIAPKWVLLSKKHEVDCYRLLRQYFKSFDTAMTDKAEQIIDLAFNIAKDCKSVSPKEALNNLFIGLEEPLLWDDEKPWTIEHIEKRLLLINKLEQHPEKEATDSAFDYDLLRFNLKQEIADIYDKHPELCWRLKKHQIKLHETGYLEVDNILMLLSLFEVISPNDIEEMMKPILWTWIPMTSKKADKLIKMLSWARDAILKEPTTANKERMSGFADRILAFMWDNPVLADEIFSLPVEKYQALCELMLTKYRFDDLKRKDFVDLFEDDKPRLAKMISESLEAIVRQEPSLIQSLHFWLNTILKMHDETFDKSQAMELCAKLEKLPLRYLSLIQQMIEVTKAQPRCIEQFIALAAALPYSEAMKNYLEKLVTLKSEDLLATMAAFNELVSDNPELLPQLITNIKLTVAVKKLKEIDRPLFLALAPKCLESMKPDCLDKIMADEKLRANLAILLRVEQDRSIDLASIFIDKVEYLDFLKNPLLETIVNHPMFAEQLSIAYSNSYQGWAWKSQKKLTQLNKSLIADAKAVIELFEITAGNPKILRDFIDAAVKNEAFFTRDITGKDAEQTLYHQLLDFYHAYKESHPEYVSSVMWLLENYQTSIARELLSVCDNQPIKSHLQNIIDLIRDDRCKVVGSMLTKLKEKPDDPLILKLLSLASQKTSSLVSQCLALDQTNDSDLYHFILKSSTDVLASDKFAKAMVLRAQGETLAFQKYLQEFDKEEIVPELKRPDMAEIKSEALEKLMLSFMNEDDVKALAEKELTAEQRVKLTLGIGKAIFSEDGIFHVERLDQIKTTSVYEKLRHTPLLKNHLDRVLESAKQNPAFAERLMKLEAPKPDSISKHILQKMLRLPSDQPVTAYHARVLAFSTICCPVRQDSVGSCFATSVVIQAASHADGLLQILEDYMSLLSHDCIRRTGSDKKVKEYTLQFDVDDFSEMFAKDNLLSRAYEYAVAKMSAAGNVFDPLIGLTKMKWGMFFGEEIKAHCQAVLPELPFDKQWEIEESIKSTLTTVAEESCLLTYNGHAKHKYTGEQGAWMLLDRETRKPLQDDKVQSCFYNKVFKKSKEQLLQSMPEDKAKITELFDKKLNAYVHSPIFHKKFFGGANYSGTGVSRINSAKYHYLATETPYLAYKGGNPEDALAAYHCQPVTSEFLPRQSNPLMILDTFARRVSDDKSMSAHHYDTLMTCTTLEHAFNLDIGKIKQLTKKGAEVTTKEMRDAASALARTALTPEVYQELIDDYIGYQDYPNKDIRKLHKKLLLKNLTSYRCLGDLCHEIVATDRELMGENRSTVGRNIDWAIRACSSLQGKLPPVFVFADTNWEKSQHLGLSARVHDGSIDYVFTSTADKPVRVPWSPGDLWKVQVERHPSGTDEISRSYSRKP